MSTRARSVDAVAEPTSQPFAPARAADRSSVAAGGRDWRRTLARVLLYAILLIGGLGMIFPFLWMMS